ncbi:MAG: hypothetical protein WCF85_05175 [Rhodospirillaceae bacterium]
MATAMHRKLDWSIHVNDNTLSINLYGVFDLDSYYDFHELMVSINRGCIIDVCLVDMSGVINISGAGAIFLLTLKRELSVPVLKIVNATSDIRTTLSRIDRNQSNFIMC